ncbi:MAG: hypothetical protein Q8R10_12930 [Pseudomonas sp.]|uniref:hypothetical protein n=1 Tax=Pseudomonas sp. TaxID=306 RepID=UPI00273300A9|nr:hypothetical protein [Pseudomonas sp.]MDP3847315.1 hypothetical protein [Pseudomonas sp.]
MPKTRTTASLAAALWLTGCAQQLPSTGTDCAALFAAREVASATSHDAQYQPLNGFVGLRSDRVLAALGPTAHSRAQRSLWLQRLAERDIEASNIELGNLAPAVTRHWRSAARQEQLQSCRDSQRQQLLEQPDDFQRAVAAAQQPDAYRGWARVLGLYPLLKPLYRQLIVRAQLASEQAPAPRDSARWLGYQPLPGAPTLASRQSIDALGLPQADPQQLAALFARHAPWLKVEQASRADRLGSPVFTANGQRDFDRQATQVFEQIGWSRLNGRWHLQLIYQFWFSHRPKPRPWDLYGGELDGLLWRVTLDEQGGALLYDSIHPCGCWQNFFLPADSPWQAREPMPQPSELEPRSVRRIDSTGDQAPTLWLSAGEHSLLSVDDRRSPYPAMSYQQRPLNALRQLAHPQGRRSLYDDEGLVSGTERLERWLLWPSGVVSPGAMRQWGQHATAFVGRAQFDDPDLLERYFVAP